MNQMKNLAKIGSNHLIDNLMEWERKFESADLEKHKQFLQEAQLLVCGGPLEATAWENGFVPEARSVPSDQLEFRFQGSLPHRWHIWFLGQDSQLALEKTLCVVSTQE